MSALAIASEIPEEQLLLQVVDRAARSGQSPQASILLRLTDNRIKVLSPRAGRSPHSLLAELAQRHGPIAAAYSVEPSADAVRVRDILRGRNWLLTPDGWASESADDQSRFAAGLSRNAAIFAASLGMSTGALPKVEAILSPPGVFS